MAAPGWLKKLFSSPPEEDNVDINEVQDFEEESSFSFNEHMRIVLAILVVFISACVMWWILA